MAINNFIYIAQLITTKGIKTQKYISKEIKTRANKKAVLVISHVIFPRLTPLL